MEGGGRREAAGGLEEGGAMEGAREAVPWREEGGERQRMGDGVGGDKKLIVYDMWVLHVGS